MLGTDKVRHDLGAGYALWTRTAPDGTKKATLARGGIPRDVVLWDGDFEALRAAVNATDLERRGVKAG